MLDERKFTKDPELKTEWLALILEIDRTLDGTGEVVPAREDYAWYSRRTEPNYVNALLERRTEMLRCDLTQTPSLQVRPPTTQPLPTLLPLRPLPAAVPVATTDFDCVRSQTAAT